MKSFLEKAELRTRLLYLNDSFFNQRRLHIFVLQSSWCFICIKIISIRAVQNIRRKKEWTALHLAVFHA